MSAGYLRGARLLRWIRDQRPSEEDGETFIGKNPFLALNHAALRQRLERATS